MKVPARGFSRLLLLISAAVALTATGNQAYPRPGEFVELQGVSPGIECRLSYIGPNNFVGTPVEGYERNKCLLTKPAALALAEVQRELRAYGLGLKVFDAYRPQRAVNHFVRWAKDGDDVENKDLYYPNVDKGDLFTEGYIASRSGHSRGSTVDLTIVSNGEELDMGGVFDYFGRRSWHSYADLTGQQRANRMLLKMLMEKYGFKPYSREWWHYTLKNEPFPDTYFDFPVR